MALVFGANQLSTLIVSLGIPRLNYWEIEDSHLLSEIKLHNIGLFANDLFDLSFIFTELWVCDRYGLNHRKVYDVRDDIAGGEKMTDAQPHEWFCDGEWRSNAKT